MAPPLLTPGLERPWLCVDLAAPRRVLSFAPYRPGFVTAARLVWREVANADLPPDLDVDAWFGAQMRGRGAERAVGLLTSHDIGRFQRVEVEVEGIRAAALATVGLGNAERVGLRHDRSPPGYGTINIAVELSGPAGWGLTDPALIEAITIAAEARTAAVIEAGLSLPRGRATGTGTDCLVIAAPPGDTPYCGLHTAQAEALGAAVHAAVAAGAADWCARYGTDLT